MLKTYLNTLPFTKFILIEDSLKQRGKNILDFIITNNLNNSKYTVNYFTFEGCFKRTETQYKDVSKVIVHDCSSNVSNWIQEEKYSRFTNILTKLDKIDIVVIDSLAHVIYKYDFAETYRILNSLCNRADVQQVIAVLHLDLLEDTNKITQYLRHLCTLTICLEQSFTSTNSRLNYTYKKVGGKIIKQIEEYKIENNQLITEKIAKPDIKIIEKIVTNQINPEDLASFKIGLSETEKSARDKLVLPYLPKNTSEISSEGQIFYTLDDVDDWDEEDPDDDLDI